MSRRDVLAGAIFCGQSELPALAKPQQKEAPVPARPAQSLPRENSAQKGCERKVALLSAAGAALLVPTCAYTRLFTVEISGQPERPDLCLAPVAEWRPGEKVETDEREDFGGC